MQVDKGELVHSALDEPPSLIALRKAVDARMPRVDLPELLLEMHARTGFAFGFTHASEGAARAGDVATSLCAVLIAEACNTDFEPLIRLDTGDGLRPALTQVARDGDEEVGRGGETALNRTEKHRQDGPDGNSELYF